MASVSSGLIEICDHKDLNRVYILVAMLDAWSIKGKCLYNIRPRLITLSEKGLIHL